MSIQYDDKDMIDLLATQRNNALNEAAAATAAIMSLQRKVAELEAQIAKVAERKTRQK